MRSKRQVQRLTEKKIDKVCAAIVAVFLLLMAAAIAIGHFRQLNEKIAYIYSDGELIDTIDLNAVEQPYEFMVGDSNSDYNIISVRQGEIAVVHATCPDKICVDRGYISTSELPIVCMPNKLVIKIGSKNGDDTVDATAE